MGRARNIQDGSKGDKMRQQWGEQETSKVASAMVTKTTAIMRLQASQTRPCAPQQLTRLSSAVVLVDGVVECPDVGRLRKGLCHRLSADDGLCLLLCSRLSASSNRPRLAVRHLEIVPSEVSPGNGEKMGQPWH